MSEINYIPEVSVIIPVYNVEAYLPACMESILNQTLENLEIILVDDQSPDNCPSICDEYARKDKRVRVIHKHNAGLGMARNSGLDIATGRWISFVDSDDCLALNTLESCVTIGNESGADMVRFMFENFVGNLPVGEVNTGDKLHYKLFERDSDMVRPMLDYIAGKPEKSLITNASACSCIYRREVIEKSGVRFHSERELISEDFIFNIDISSHCKAIAYTDYRFYFYRFNPISLSKTLVHDRLDKSEKFCKYLETHLASLGYSDAIEIAVANMIGNWRMHLRSIYASSLPGKEKRRLHNLAARHPYIESISRDGYDSLPLFQRLVFVMRGSYTVSRLLFGIRDYFKK